MMENECRETIFIIGNLNKSLYGIQKKNDDHLHVKSSDLS